MRLQMRLQDVYKRQIQYSLGDRKLGEYGLYADRDIEALTVPAAWKHICGMFFIF